MDWQNYLSFAERLYRLRVRHATSLQPQPLDWRNIMKLDTFDQGSWLLRLLRVPDAAASIAHTAALLGWLEANSYPAPRVRQTVTGAPVGVAGEWTMLCVSFIDGPAPTLASTDFMALGAALGRLHALPHHSAVFSRSRCHPVELQATIRQLAQGVVLVPEAFRPMLAALHDDMRLLLPALDVRSLTHGDCWYQNAIALPDGTATLIDWDCAGIGAPLLDLGYLLLTSHYDLAQPLVITPNSVRIAAILRGYRAYAALPPISYAVLRSAVRFVLAFQLGNDVADQQQISTHDSFLQKTWARFQATEEIAAVAKMHFPE